MRKLLISLGALVLSSVVVAAEEQETVKVWSVDYKGKPPFKRTLKRLPVSDVAQFETAQDVETVAVKVRTGSKPPFKRRTVNLPVVDAAQFEIEENKSKPDFRGKPPFKR
jgi:hypothetical protein